MKNSLYVQLFSIGLSLVCVTAAATWTIASSHAESRHDKAAAKENYLLKREVALLQKDFENERDGRLAFQSATNDNFKEMSDNFKNLDNKIDFIIENYKRARG